MKLRGFIFLFVGLSFLLVSSSCNATQPVGIPDVLKNKRFTATYEDCSKKVEAPSCTPTGLRSIMSAQFDFGTNDIVATFGTPSAQDNVFLPMIQSFSNFSDIINGKKSPSLLTGTENVSVDDFVISSGFIKDANGHNTNVFNYKMEFDLTFYTSSNKFKYKEKLNWIFDYDLTGGNSTVRVEMGRKTTTAALPDVILFDQYPMDTDILNIGGFDGSGFYNVSVSSIPF